MTIKGEFKNGVIVPEVNPNVPDGTKVEILVIDKSPLGKAIGHFAGTMPGPADFARNHDHYIHGKPKQ